MRISRDQRIAGHPAFGVRKLLRLADNRCNDYLTVADAERILHLKQSAAQNITSRLEREGYLKPPITFGNVSGWALSGPKAFALCGARGGKRICRQTADRLLAQVAARANAINTSPEYLWKITCLVVFGSYLTEAETLGDLDLAFQPAPKIMDKAKFCKELWYQSHKAQLAGRRFRTRQEFLHWPERKVLLGLQNRSHSISLHELRPPQDDWIFNQRHRIVLGARPTLEDNAIWI